MLTLPNREEFVIKVDVGTGECYFEGQVEGIVIPAKFFGSLSDAVSYAERRLRRRGIKLMMLLQQEDRWKLKTATPIQRALLQDWGHPATEMDVPKRAAADMIRQYVRGER